LLYQGFGPAYRPSFPGAETSATLHLFSYPRRLYSIAILAIYDSDGTLARENLSQFPRVTLISHTAPSAVLSANPRLLAFWKQSAFLAI